MKPARGGVTEVTAVTAVTDTFRPYSQTQPGSGWVGKPRPQTKGNLPLGYYSKESKTKDIIPFLSAVLQNHRHPDPKW